LRVTIMVSNLRARRVWEKNGFIMFQQFTGNMGDKGQTDFVILTKKFSNT
jgi:RimJ/RimL family protein N-acetyltransferase